MTDEVRDAVGSPPRAWGRLTMPIYSNHPCRFTPTCVGTAQTCMYISGFSSVHPHVRGDGQYSLRMRSIAIGSPPRAWGRRVGVLELFAAVRFTPTCVGTAPRSKLSGL